MEYPTLEKFMELNGYKDKVKAKKLLDRIKENHKKGKYFILNLNKGKNHD